jgi:hypothetical protein
MSEIALQLVKFSSLVYDVPKIIMATQLVEEKYHKDRGDLVITLDEQQLFVHTIERICLWFDVSVR